MKKVTLAVLSAGVLALAGACSDDSSDGASDESTSSTSATDSGQSSSALPPVIVDSAEDVSLEVGEFIDIVTDGADKAESSDPSVLEASNARSEGDAEFNAGAEALAPGTAVLSVYGGNDLLYEVDVTVEG